MNLALRLAAAALRGTSSLLDDLSRELRSEWNRRNREQRKAEDRSRFVSSVVGDIEKLVEPVRGRA